MSQESKRPGFRKTYTVLSHGARRAGDVIDRRTPADRRYDAEMADPATRHQALVARTAMILAACEETLAYVDRTAARAAKVKRKNSKTRAKAAWLRVGVELKMHDADERLVPVPGIGGGRLRVHGYAAIADLARRCKAWLEKDVVVTPGADPAGVKCVEQVAA